MQLLRTIVYVDNYVDVLPFLSMANIPSLGSGVFWLKYILAHSIYTFGTVTGWALGYQTWMREYAPKELWGIADKGALGEQRTGKKRAYSGRNGGIPCTAKAPSLGAKEPWTHFGLCCSKCSSYSRWNLLILPPSAHTPSLPVFSHWQSHISSPDTPTRPISRRTTPSPIPSPTPLHENE